MSETSIDICSEERKTKKVFIVHASVGSGHKTAAEAIEYALQHLKEADVRYKNCDYEVSVFDILDFGRIVFDGNAVASSFTGATRPYYDFTWRYTFTGHLLWGGGTCFSRVMFPKFTQLVRVERPDAIVCTHITGANAVVGAKLITKQSFPIICVPTDYEVEGLWPHKYTDLFCVANEQMAETLRARKIKDSRIKITGMPASPIFREIPDKDICIKEFDLPDNKTNILVLAGASLPRPYVQLRKVINSTLQYAHRFENLYFSIVVGKDKEYKAELKSLIEQHALKNVRIFGFVEEMAKLMNASDVVVCKPGGMTVTECLCSSVPMILTCRAYGQEKANVKMLTAFGAAVHVTTPRELLDTLDLVDKDKNVLSGIKRSACVIRRPNASIDIARLTMKLIRDNDDTEKRKRKHFLTLYWGKKPAHPR